MSLDWPVRRGGTAILGADGAATAYRQGTGPGERFRVASVTKLLSATATLVAVEAGLLDLDDQVPKAGASVRHLLAHASGLPPEQGGRRLPPGERRVYSNLGFRVLGRAVEDAVGISFEGWLADRVLAPLGMAATELGPYDGVAADPAAGVVSTLPDLASFAGCLLAGGAPVVSRELLGEACSVQFPGLAGIVPGIGRFDPCDWGLGFELHDGKRPHWMGARRSAGAFGHFGATGCFLLVDPAAGVAAAAVSDRPFGDGGWAMRTWPEWCDRLPFAGVEPGGL